MSDLEASFRDLPGGFVSQRRRETSCVGSCQKETRRVPFSKVLVGVSEDVR